MTDERYRDMAEAQRLTLAALDDAEGIERDAAGWSAPGVVTAAQDAADALRSLADEIGAALPGAAS